MTRPPLIPSRRTTIVLGCLLAAMTLVSVLLMLLEPGPTAPLHVLKLSTLDREQQPEVALFATIPAATPQRWQAIVIRLSGTAGGSARTLDQLDQSVGKGGLGQHFVIGNGQGSTDGQIEVGYRWRQQLTGGHSAGRYGQWFNQHAVGICLIGQGDRQAPTPRQMSELVWLVQQLQSRLSIPADHVFIESGTEVTGSVPRAFPVAWFRQQLLWPTAN